MVFYGAQLWCSLVLPVILLLTCYPMEAAVIYPDQASHLPCDLSAKMCRALPTTDPKFQEQCYVEKDAVDLFSPPTISDCASACRPGVDNRQRCRSLCKGL